MSRMLSPLQITVTMRSPLQCYSHYGQPGEIYTPYVQAGPNYLPHAQYLSSYPPYMQSMPNYPNDVPRPLEERQLGHEGIQRRDFSDLEQPKPNRPLRFSIVLRSNKKVIEDEESRFHNYPPIKGSGRPRQTAKEVVDAETFDIVSTQCIPAEDGCQTISLVLMDQNAMRSHHNVRCESHWRHLNHDILNFEQLYKHATDIECIEDDDLAVVAQLLNKVQKTSEKKFVYGRYLKPTTVVYDGEESSGVVRKISKTATFVSLPLFWLERPRERMSTKDSAGHPSRTLLQSRYRLERTEKRDQEQVIAKSRPNENRIVHVPQIWALIINRNIIITCAPFDASVLCGDSIKTIPYAVARADEATCVCLDDQQKSIQDELLSSGPIHKILTEDGAIVNAETWPRMVEADRADLIHLKLVSEPTNFIVQDNPSTGRQNTSPPFASPDTEDDDINESLRLHPISADETRQKMSALEQLRQLQGHLRNAILQAEGAHGYELKRMQMPVLNALIDALTTNPSEMKWCDIPGLENINFLRDPGVSKNDVLNGERLKSKTKSRRALLSHNKPFSTLYHDKNIDHKDSEHKSLEDKKPEHENLKHENSEHENHINPEHDNFEHENLEHENFKREDIEHEDTRQAGEATRSKDDNQTHKSKMKVWFDLTNEVENIDKIDETNLVAEAEDNENPNEAELVEEIKHAESTDNANDFEKPHDIQVDYEIEEIDETQEADEANGDKKVDGIDNLDENFSVQEPDKYDGPDQVNTLYEPNEVTPVEAESRTQYPREKPRVEKLLRLARKEVFRALNIKKSSVVVENLILPFEVPEADHLPIFLWSIGQVESKAFAYASRNMAAASNPEELILHTILKEAHAKLGNMSGGLPGQLECAVLYEVADSKSALEVNILLFEARRRGLTTSNQEGAQDHINGEKAERLTEKGTIFDLSDKIIHAFVPRECESPSVAKYWGSVFGFLAEKDVAASHNFILRLNILWSLIQEIHSGVHTTDGSKKGFHIPQALPAAFQQLIMFFVLSSSTSLEPATMTTFESCKALLLEGKKQLILMNHTFDLRGRVDFKAVDPQALLALMMSNLVTKISPEGDCDLTEVYSEYALDIQHMVRDRASVQMYDKIKLLQEEIDVIKAGLVQQNSVLRDLKSIIWESRQGASLTKNVVDRVLECIEQRIEDFDELQVQADNARFLAAQSISLKAENNSKAVLVFTVTTIIFLPLSFVTSYLGMNTSDLRSTSSGQSLFWIVGVPLTLVILALALVVAFFGSLWQRALRMMKWLKEKYD
ncbi:MAG: hypothetical protein Q9195_009352 [Heterodermia aff. obscurata]